RGERGRAHLPRRASLRRRHAREHLQRDAARGHRCAHRLHEGVPASPRVNPRAALRTMRYRILTLNNISARGLERLPRDRYDVGSDVKDPQGILVRSADMHSATVPESVLAIARAGAGTNNIPVSAMSKRGIPVFNAPGANANAVKELVLASLFLAARNICQAWDFARQLKGDDETIDKAVEAGKKKFV